VLAESVLSIRSVITYPLSVPQPAASGRTGFVNSLVVEIVTANGRSCAPPCMMISRARRRRTRHCSTTMAVFRCRKGRVLASMSIARRSQGWQFTDNLPITYSR
jgi:hypothetical protein